MPLFHELLGSHLKVELELVVEIGANARAVAPRESEFRRRFMRDPARASPRSSTRATLASRCGDAVCLRR